MVHNLDTDCVVRLSVDWLLLASTEAEWSQIYPVGALLLVGVGVAIAGGLASLSWAMSESTPERGHSTSPNFFGGDR